MTGRGFRLRLRRLGLAITAALVASAAIAVASAGAAPITLDPGRITHEPSSVTTLSDGSGGAYFGWIRYTGDAQPLAAEEAVVCHVPAGGAACDHTVALPNYFVGAAYQAPRVIYLTMDPSTHTLYAVTASATSPVRIFASGTGGLSFTLTGILGAMTPVADGLQRVLFANGLLLGLFSSVQNGTAVDAFGPSGGNTGFASLAGGGPGSGSLGLSSTALVAVSTLNDGALRVWDYGGDFSQHSLNTTASWFDSPVQSFANEGYAHESGSPGPVALLSYAASGHPLNGHNFVRIWNGTSFRAAVDVGQLGLYDDIAAGSASTIYAAGANANCGLQVSVSQNGGQTFASPFQVIQPQSGVSFQSLAVAALGQSGWAMYAANNQLFAASFGSSSTASCANGGGATTPSGGAGSVHLSSLSVFPRKQSIAGRKVNGKCVKLTRKNNGNAHCQRPAQLTIKYALNGAANVAFSLFRQTTGRKVKGKCVKLTKKNQKNKTCTLYPKLASVTRGGNNGTNSFTVKGKLFGRKLTPGAYVLKAQLSGGPLLQVSFRIKS
jgi:hypothetical protein